MFEGTWARAASARATSVAPTGGIATVALLAVTALSR
jgi:hypothetical protein